MINRDGRRILLPLLAVLAALMAGLYPALRAARLSVVDALQSAGTKSSVGLRERRLLAGVTMTQAALTLTLLIGPPGDR